MGHAGGSPRTFVCACCPSDAEQVVPVFNRPGRPPFFSPAVVVDIKEPVRSLRILLSST